MKEAVLRRKIMKKLQETYGGFWFHPHGNPYTMSGIPDIIGCVRGRYIALEVKRPDGGDATVKQKWTLERITQAGGVAGVIRSFEDAQEILDFHSVSQSPAGEDPDPDVSG